MDERRPKKLLAQVRDAILSWPNVLIRRDFGQL